MLEFIAIKLKAIAVAVATLTTIVAGTLGLGGTKEVIPEEPATTTDSIIAFPAGVNTDLERLEYAYRAEELLRLEYNSMGERFRNGELSADDWKAYQNRFFKKSEKLHNYIAPNRDKLMKDILQVTDLLPINQLQRDFIQQQIRQKKTEFKQSPKWDADIDLMTIIK